MLSRLSSQQICHKCSKQEINENENNDNFFMNLPSKIVLNMKSK